MQTMSYQKKGISYRQTSFGFMSIQKNLTENFFCIYLCCSKTTLLQCSNKTLQQFLLTLQQFFMQKILQVGKTKWIFIQTPDKKTIDKLAQEYDFHEMIIDDILEINGQSKIDTSSNCFFLELTFTKYDIQEGRYVSNELDVVIKGNTIITTIGIASESFNETFEAISKEVEKTDESSLFKEWNIASLDNWNIAKIKKPRKNNETKHLTRTKSSPYYILYRIIDGFYDKAIKSLASSSKKLLAIQDAIASKGEGDWWFNKRRFK